MSQAPPSFPSGFTPPPEVPAYQAEAPIYRSIAVSNPLTSTSDVDRSVDPTWGDASYVKDQTQTSTKELTATSYVGQTTPTIRQVPTSLKSLGTFYQPSSLICATSIGDAWTSILSHFHTQRVEFTSDVNKAKLRGLFAVPHDSSLIHFRLRLYNASHLYPDSTTSIIAIEIQRRMGCIVAFHDFFRTCATAMGDRLLTTPLPVASKPMPVLKAPPSTSSSTSTSTATSTTSTTTSASSSTSSSSSSSLATLPLPDHSEVELDSTTLTTLTRQLHSKDLITNRTAMSALAHITYHHPSNQHILIQEITTQHATTPITTPTSTLPSSASLITIILHLLHTHRDADLHRGAAMVLANLCEHSRFVELAVVSPPLIQALFSLLDIHATYKTPTTTSSIPPSLFTPLLERGCHRAIASMLYRCSNAHPQLFLQSMTTASTSHPQGLQHYLYLLDFFRDRANDGHDIACANQWDATRRLCTAH